MFALLCATIKLDKSVPCINEICSDFTLILLASALSIYPLGLGGCYCWRDCVPFKIEF